MKRPPDLYGDNFPVTAAWSWDPRAPWRHAHVLPTVPPRWWHRAGWWTVVMLLMGALMLLAARDGFSEEPSAGALIVQFREGVVQYPEDALRALFPRVTFHPVSLQRLNARYGLIAVERVTSRTAPTPRQFKLLFASPTALTRALAAYQRDPNVVAAAPASLEPSPAWRSARTSLYTRGA